MIIFSLCTLVFINAMSIGLVFPIFAPLFTQSTQPFFSPGTSLSTQSFFYTMILAVPTLFMLFGAPFWGKISDRIGRRKVLIVGLLGIAASFIFSSLGILIGSLFLLFFSRALAGFMDGTEPVAQATIIDLSSPEEKIRNMGYATFAGTIGFIIGPVMGGFLAEPSLTGRFHYEMPFLAALLLTLLNVLAIYFFLPKQIRIKITSPDANISYRKLLSKGFAICFDKRLLRFSFLLFVLQWCLAAYFQLTSLALVEKHHYSPSQIGLFTTFLGACFSGGIFFVIHVLLHRIKHSTLLKIGIMLIVVSILSALYFLNSTLLAWVSVVPMMLGIAMMYNVLLGFVSNAVTEDEQGEAMGGGTALKALGWLTSAVVVGTLYPHISLILLIMLTLVVLAFISALRIK